MGRILWLLLFCIFARVSTAYDASDTAVILIDMQYGFYERGGVEHTPELQALVENQKKLLKAAVENELNIVVLEFSDYGDTNRRLFQILDDYENTTVLTKEFNDGFTNPDLKSLLESNNIKHLAVAGVNGSACVRATVFSALDEGFSVVTSREVVGNLNFNPPIYPDATWYPRNSKFKGYETVGELLNALFQSAI